MKTSLLQFENNAWVNHPASQPIDETKTQLVLCFAEKDKLAKGDFFVSLKERFPRAHVALCSTAGEIYHDVVQDDSVVAVALQFDQTPIRSASVNISDFADSYAAAVALVQKLPQPDLSYIMVISDGSAVNGSELAKGLNDTAGKDVIVTGGLAGDGSRFSSTLVGLNAQPSGGEIVAIGFYGKKLQITTGSGGGWDMFGLAKQVTKSTDNVLFEINDESALELYKKYLGPEAENLPSSALLFPLAVVVPGSSEPVTRTILSIDEKNQSMTFAGDVPVGSSVRFMKANFDRLTSAASTAAANTLSNKNGKPSFSLLISCVGRKLILGLRIDEEVEAVADWMGSETLLAGFYSYGEISPFNEGGRCQLHNQTMTITSFYEVP